LLPGEPEAVLSREGSPNVVFPEPLTSSHPIFFAFGDSIDQVVWNVLPIFRSWSFKSLTENTQVLMKLSDSSGPLLVLQRRGRGQIVTLTTPIPEVDSRERELWNLLWANDPVPAFAILLGAFRYLSGANQSGLNYESGQPVGLPNEPLTWPSRYELFLPTAQSRRVDALEGNLNLGIFETAGTFRLRGQRAEPVARAFSVNVPEQDTSLERMERVALDEHLGRNHYRLARSQDEVESSVGQARFGQELYPLVMLFVAGLFLAEQAMSNRFYKIQFGGTKGSSNVV
jgi:hypothetical protein